MWFEKFLFQVNRIFGFDSKEEVTEAELLEKLEKTDSVSAMQTQLSELKSKVEEVENAKVLSETESKKTIDGLNETIEKMKDDSKKLEDSYSAKFDEVSKKFDTVANELNALKGVKISEKKEEEGLPGIKPTEEKSKVAKVDWTARTSKLSQFN